ncbi:MAG: DUF6625 family protein [Verrucomicrobiota bacterium]
MPARALIIAIYFGKLPSWLPLWFESCANNPSFNWLLISDQTIEVKPPSNVLVKHMTLDSFQKTATQTLGLEACLPGPYKICDFRPAFGVIFAEEIAGYDFWGYCDLDVIFGRLDRFLTDEVLTKHDQILVRGHLCLLRNSETINNAFRSESAGPGFENVFTQSKHYIFDEWHGIHAIMKSMAVPLYVEEVCADIIPDRAAFKTSRGTNYTHQAFVWRDGRIERLFRKDANAPLESEERAYIHFQKRKLHSSLQTCPDCGLMLNARGFFPIESQDFTAEELLAANPPPTWLQFIQSMSISDWRILIGKKRRELLGKTPVQ